MHGHFAGFRNKRFELEFNIEDAQKKFRWFNPEFLRLVLVDTEEELSGKHEMLAPKGMRVVDASGKRRFPENGFVSDGPLSFSLTFSIPKEVKETGYYGLFYFSGPDSKQMILNGEYPDGW